MRAMMTCLAVCLGLGACGDGQVPSDFNPGEIEVVASPTLLRQPQVNAAGTVPLTGRVVVDEVRHCFAFEPADQQGVLYGLVVPRGSRFGGRNEVVTLPDGVKMPVGETLTVAGEVLDFANGDDTPEDWFKCADGEYRFVAVAGGA
ncbi:hypothetical protein AB0N29_07100 [Nocardioides sp. NPDC092400]|uniref:hypothetical protein n=1 Tax=Nocardioides sp. NPDC092400 TaxID=3155196 RepID=UPI00342DF86E